MEGDYMTGKEIVNLIRKLREKGIGRQRDIGSYFVCGNT